MKKETTEMKQTLLKNFLELKNTTLKKCTGRQNEILKKEEPEMWEMYTWNLEQDEKMKHKRKYKQ